LNKENGYRLTIDPKEIESRGIKNQKRGGIPNNISKTK
jgi:hypothetical protein